MTVQGPVKKLQPYEMSHGGGVWRPFHPGFGGTIVRSGRTVQWGQSPEGGWGGGLVAIFHTFRRAGHWHVPSSCAQVTFLVEHLQVHRVACVYQADMFGDQEFDALTTTLRAIDWPLVAAYRWLRGPPKRQALKAVEAIFSGEQRPQAIVVAMAAPLVPYFLRAAKLDPRADPDTAYMMTSVGYVPNFRRLFPGKRYWDNLYFTQIVPSVDSQDSTFVSQWREDMQRFGPDTYKACAPGDLSPRSAFQGEVGRPPSPGMTVSAAPTANNKALCFFGHPPMQQGHRCATAMGCRSTLPCAVISVFWAISSLL